MEMLEVFDCDNNSLGYSVSRDEVHEKNYGIGMYQHGL